VLVCPLTSATSAGTEFSIDAYEAMRDDATRTPAFVEALRRRLAGTAMRAFANRNVRVRVRL
jgi:hypothetical protein